jgi:hypothetical protein
VDISTVCTDTFVTIYNKQREQFSIDVPVSLKLENVKIDSLDSLLYQNGTTNSCLSKREKCCKISSSGNSIESLDGSQSC